jgi:drug/metabolite transporter (DMT)-like permease
MSDSKGIFLILLTALVSGVSIFANSFAVKGLNPFIFTFLKNAAVAAFLLSIIILIKDFSKLKKLSKKQLMQLASIGLIGGSIPFLLFFYALQSTTAINAGFLHKTLFLWAALFAFLFLKEKISKRFILAALLLLSANFLLFNFSQFGLPEGLILLATVLWAGENALSKHALKNLSGTIVAFGRMFFGSLFILAFLLLSNQATGLFTLSTAQLQWTILTSLFLLAFVFTYYSGLKHLPLHKAASILLLAQPITALLSFAFLGKPLSLEQGFAFLLITAGLFLLFGLGFVLNKYKTRHFSYATERT